MTIFRVRISLWLLGSTILLLLKSAHASEEDLVKWLTSQDGGFFDEKQQEIRAENPEDATSRPGIFARERIEKGEVLATIPWNIIITPQEEEEVDEEEAVAAFSCATARNLAKEFLFGKTKSDVAPYVEHLTAQSLKYQLPSSYSQAGMELFVEVLGGNENPDILMDNMETSMGYLLYDWYEVCDGSVKDKRSATAAMLVMQHSVQDLMIPIVDLYTHRNGNWFNTQTKIVSGEYVQVVARRDIEAGEQLHSSYNQCDGCDEEDDVGTPGTF
jgi:hypothetical protein